jgi:selenophosphate synthase
MSLNLLLENTTRASSFDPSDYDLLRGHFPPPLVEDQRLPFQLKKHNQRAFGKLAEAGLPQLPRVDEYVSRRADEWFERVTTYAAKLKAADQVLDWHTMRFRLTRYAALKGCGCKVPQAELLDWLVGSRTMQRSTAKGFLRPSGIMSDTYMGGEGSPVETSVELGVGMDASVVRLPYSSTSKASAREDAGAGSTDNRKDLYLISTTDFFFPLVEDPYLMGRIAAANVLSDAYALGIRMPPTTMLMLLCAARDIESADLRAAVAQTMMAGFMDACHDAGTQVTGGQTTLNPWPLIGGVAETVIAREDFIMPDAALPGDTIVLTKPLGTQLAVNLYQWLGQMEDDHYIRVLESVENELHLTQQEQHSSPETHQQWNTLAAGKTSSGEPEQVTTSTNPVWRMSRAVASSVLEQLPASARLAVAQGRQARLHYAMVEDVLSPAEVCRAYDLACASMARLNARAAQLLHETGAAHAVTDITGFGILGHARNLARNQRASVDFEIHTLPVIQGMMRANSALNNGRMFRLHEGLSAETSGGLFICFGAASSAQDSESVARQFCERLSSLDGGWPAWIIGKVVSGNREARLIDQVKILEV